MSAELVASYLEAVGTIAAVVVALFTQVFLRWKRRPRLELRGKISDSRPEAGQDLVVIRSPDGSKDQIIEVWIRLRVWAVPGKRPARGVKAIVTQVHRTDAPMTQVVPSGPLNWSSVGAQPQTLLAGTWMRLDILRYRVVTPGYTRQLEIEIGYKFHPDDQQTVLDAGDYEIDIALGSEESKTTYWRLAVVHRPNADAATDDELLAQVEMKSLKRLQERA